MVFTSEDEFNDVDIDNPKEARFNMAIDTLMRLGNLLREIKDVYHNPRFLPYFDEGTMQYIKYKLVRTFFIQATALLPTNSINEIKPKVFALKPAKQNIMETRSGSACINKGTKYVFSQDFEDQMDNILIDIQVILKDNGMIMPSKDESDLF